MEQENTDFDFIEEYRHDVSDRVKALQAAYDQDGAVKRLNVSEKEVGASPLPFFCMQCNDSQHDKIGLEGTWMCGVHLRRLCSPESRVAQQVVTTQACKSVEGHLQAK